MVIKVEVFGEHPETYYFTAQRLAEDSWRETYSSKGRGCSVQFKKAGGVTDVFFVTASSRGVDGQSMLVGRITDLTVSGLIRDRVEHF